MRKIRSVYMETDLEGAAGVDNWDPRHFDYAAQAKGVFERSEMQRLLTAEVNAAAMGLFDAGVAEIVVNDSHGAGRTILVEELIAGVKIARGKMRPYYGIGMSRRADAFVVVGMHAMTGTPHACLAHTMGRNQIYRLNGQEVGEMELVAYIAGELGFPWIFVSGDLHACREAESFVPGIVTAPVKEGLSEECAIHLAPVDARKLIRARIREAVEKADAIKPLLLKGPVTLENYQVTSDTPQSFPGIEEGKQTPTRYTGSSVWQVCQLAFYRKPDIPPPTDAGLHIGGGAASLA